MRPPASPLPPRPALLNDAAMVFLRTCGIAALLCVLYIAFANERTGFILLGALSIAALAAGVVVVLAYRDQLGVLLEPAPEEAPVARPVHFGPLPAPTGTPLAGAAAIVLVVSGLLYGVSLIVVGVIVGLLTVFVVTALLTGDHRGQPVNLLPFTVPLVAFAVIGTFMFFMSRMLLAVNKDFSVIVAIGVAILILMGGFLVANTPQVATRTLVRAGAVLALLFAGGGLTAYAVGQRPEERKAGPPAQTVVAKNIAFEQKHLNFEAGTAVTVDFKNEDVNVPHNMDFTVDQAGAQSFYKQDPVPGPISATYSFTAPKAGSYFYHCDVHPNMTGTVTVTGPGGGEPGQAGSPSTTAGKATGATAATTERTTTTTTTKAAPAAAGGGGTSADLAAQNIEYSKTTLAFKGNSPVVIHFDNKDSVPHNVDITTDEGGSNTIFKEDPFSGPKEVDYKFTTPAPGKLYYHCDVHPNMKGTINVQ
jgi:plastocyanin